MSGKMYPVSADARYIKSVILYNNTTHSSAGKTKT